MYGVQDSAFRRSVVGVVKQLGLNKRILRGTLRIDLSSQYLRHYLGQKFATNDQL